MTARLPAVTAREVVRVAERLDFVQQRQKGSHAIYYRESDGARVVIPLHVGKTIKPKTLLGIIHDMGVTKEQFREML